jgi:hypothetical protein
VTPIDVLALCHRREVELSAVVGKLKFRGPAEAVDAGLKELLREHKSALLALLAPCPQCARATDRGRCWWCHYRLCERCHRRNTGSAFLASCLLCEVGREGAG